MTVLADTSVWIDHFRRGNARLARELEQANVAIHPFVIGELACGQLERRLDTLDLLGRLPSAVVATHAEVLAFVERRQLMGRGIGYVDAHLLASAALSPDIRLWTLDKTLASVADHG